MSRCTGPERDWRPESRISSRPPRYRSPLSSGTTKRKTYIFIKTRKPLSDDGGRLQRHGDPVSRQRLAGQRHGGGLLRGLRGRVRRAAALAQRHVARGLQPGLPAGGAGQRPGHLGDRLQDEEDGQHGVVPQPGRGRLPVHRLPAAERGVHRHGLPLALWPLPVQGQQHAGLPQHVRQRVPAGPDQRRPLPGRGVAGVGAEPPQRARRLGGQRRGLAAGPGAERALLRVPGHGAGLPRRERDQLLQQLRLLRRLRDAGRGAAAALPPPRHDRRPLPAGLRAALRRHRGLLRRHRVPAAAQPGAGGARRTHLPHHRGGGGGLLPVLGALPRLRAAGDVQPHGGRVQPRPQPRHHHRRAHRHQPGLPQQLPQPPALRLRGPGLSGQGAALRAVRAGERAHGGGLPLPLPLALRVRPAQQGQVHLRRRAVSRDPAPPQDSERRC